MFLLFSGMSNLIVPTAGQPCLNRKCLLRLSKIVGEHLLNY
jgi:hypothetical protein